MFSVNSFLSGLIVNRISVVTFVVNKIIIFYHSNYYYYKKTITIIIIIISTIIIVIQVDEIWKCMLCFLLWMEIIFSKWNNTFYPKIKRCIVNFITGTSVDNQHLLVMLINVNGALDRFYLKFIPWITSILMVIHFKNTKFVYLISLKIVYFTIKNKPWKIFV